MCFLNTVYVHMYIFMCSLTVDSYSYKMLLIYILQFFCRDGAGKDPGTIRVSMIPGCLLQTLRCSLWFRNNKKCY